MKRVILLSQNFPPSSIASVHRCRHLAKYLPEFGWQPTVLTVDERFHKEPPEPRLAALVPESVEVIRVPAIPVNPLSRLGIGDLSLRSYPFIRRRLAQLLDTEKYDLVFITGWPFYHMWLSGWIYRCWNIPVVLDFQDPWVSSAGAGSPAFSKAGITHRLAMALEPRAVRGAAFITSVSDRQNEEMAVRYPWLDRSCMAGIPIGGDPEDFDVVRGNGTAKSESEPILFSYIGTALPRATLLFQVLMRAVARLRVERPLLAARMRLRFVGTSNQASDNSTFRVRPLAEQEGVSDLVSEEPARAPFLDALRNLATTDVNLMIGSDEPHYTASKIYPGLMSGRPFLSIFHRMSSAHDILTRAGGGVTFAFETPDELNALVSPIAGALEQLVIDPGSPGQINPAAYAQFTARATAECFSNVFEQATQSR